MQRHAPGGTRAIQTIGWIGVILIFGAYALMIVGVFTPGNVWYLLANLFGALAIVIETRFRKDYQPLTLNIVWALVALYGLLAAIGR